MNVEDKVLSIVASQVGIQAKEIDLEDTTETLCMDSLDEVETIMSLEEEFDIEINDYQAEKFNTVRDIVDFITVNQLYNTMSKEAYSVAKEVFREEYNGKTIHGVVDNNKYPLSYTYKQLEGKDLVAHKNGYMDEDKSLFCKKGNIYKIDLVTKEELGFIDETGDIHYWDLYDVGEYFYPVDKVKDNLYNPVKNISREKYQRCVGSSTSSKVFRSNTDGGCLWMFPSNCDKYYYWCGYNFKNEVIYFRGEVDWVEKNYDQVSKDDVIVSFDSDGVVGDCKWDSCELGCDEEYVSVVELPEADEYVGSITEWTDKHYDFNYTLTEDDIENGVIKIDPYFVNRMWRINSWDDTGAAFHCIKNFARISNNKNPLERDLRSQYKQIKKLCELHGVDLDE